jgi:HSP20 family protein
MRFDPFRELDRFAQLAQGGRSGLMQMDAYRDGDRIRVHFDLPGVDPDAIDLTVEKNVLTVNAERRWADDDKEIIVNERPQGSFSRQLFLGESLDTDHVEAVYEQGVLTLTIPVAEQAKPRRVNVSSGDQRTSIEASSSEE